MNLVRFKLMLIKIIHLNNLRTIIKSFTEIRAEEEKTKDFEIMLKYFDMSCDWDDCHEIFNTFEEAQMHYDNVHQNPNGYIKCCDIQFNEWRLVKDHINWHLNPEFFKYRLSHLFFFFLFGNFI